ncbi:MAG: N-methyl-D-aspartate receptor NMDAR2C subunit [Armatimonadota bacterium]
MIQDELKVRWQDVWRPYGTESESDRVFDELSAAYGAPDRHYHTLGHVADCLRTLDSCRNDAEDAAAVEIALWFHDAVYDTHAGDNEEQSALWAVRELGGDGRANSVHRLILATKHGATESSDRDDRLIADIDLVILGKDEAIFWAYEDAICREYAWVPETVFRTKRAEILSRFLQRDRIYQTARFHEQYDAAARANLAASIARLNSDH